MGVPSFFHVTNKAKKEKIERLLELQGGSNRVNRKS